MQIDWRQVAEPQADGSDTEAVIALSGKPLERFNDPFMFCDGLVAVRERKKQTAPWLADGPLDHPNIAKAESLLKLWPEGYRSFTGLINVFYPLTDKQRPDVADPLGSTCGSDESEPGAIYATVYSDLGLGEALVHECGHEKLRRLGIFLERHERLIGNDSSELFDSPIRKDKLRPMSAVLHANFSYTAVTNLDVAIVEAQAHPRAMESLKINVARIREGRDTLRTNLRATPGEGEAFFSGYFDWLNRVIEKAETLTQRASSFSEEPHG